MNSDPFPSVNYKRLVLGAALVDIATLILLTISGIGFLTDFYTISYWNFIIFGDQAYFLNLIFGGIMALVIHFPRILLTLEMRKPNSSPEVTVQLVTWRLISTILVITFSILSIVLHYFLLVFVFNAVLDTVLTLSIWFMSRKLQIKANWRSIGQLKRTLKKDTLVPQNDDSMEFNSQKG